MCGYSEPVPTLGPVPATRIRTMIVHALVALALLAGCSGGGTDSTTRSIVVLSADDNVEIVVPDDAFTKEVVTTTTVAPTTTGASTTTVAPTATVAPTTGATPSETTEGSAGDVGAGEPATATTIASTTTSTTTTQPPKETIPLAEEDINPGLKLMDALENFNSCLDSEGFEFMGLPNEEAGPGAVVNSPDYLEALSLCNSRTGIATAFQDFQTARTNLAPDQIREDNEEFIALTECLRQKGWTIGELLPDENGLLGPGGSFQNSDGEINTDEIRDCVSELSLAADDS